MGNQIADRYNPSQQMKVNEDGSINTRQSDGTTELSLTDLKNLETTDLLMEIIKQLKIMNLHLSILTDNTINKEEVE